MSVISSASGSLCWRGLDYYKSKKIKLDKENWIVTENHHEAIITRLNINNNIKYISVISNNEIEIIKTNGSDK